MFISYWRTSHNPPSLPTCCNGPNQQPSTPLPSHLLPRTLLQPLLPQITCNAIPFSITINLSNSSMLPLVHAAQMWLSRFSCMPAPSSPASRASPQINCTLSESVLNGWQSAQCTFTTNLGLPPWNSTMRVRGKGDKMHGSRVVHCPAWWTWGFHWDYITVNSNFFPFLMLSGNVRDIELGIVGVTT